MLYTLLAGTQALYEVSTVSLCRRTVEIAVSAELHYKILKGLPELQIKEQGDFATQAAEAAYTSLNKLDLIQNFHAEIYLASTDGSDIFFVPNSNSVGLPYALALALEWRKQLNKKDTVLCDIFATGKIHNNGIVKKIGGLLEKIQAVHHLIGKKREKAPPKPFIIFYPSDNKNEIPNNLQLDTRKLGGKLIPVNSLQQALVSLLGDSYDGDSVGRWHPFKGLSSFNFEDNRRFFGRDDVIGKLLSHYQSNQGKLLVVSGVSGSGKSSAVKAGLVPAIQKSQAQKESLHFIETTPKLHGSIQQLLNHLFKFMIQVWGADSQPEELTDLILSTPASLYQQLNKDQEKEGNVDKKIVLFIDQYEELLTHSNIAQEQSVVLAAMLENLANNSMGLSIIISVRSEYLESIGQYGVDIHISHKLSPQQWSEIIEKQALYNNLQYEGKLAECIKNDVYDIGHGLPIVGYLLEQLYNKAIEGDGFSRELKQADYDELGGLQGVIAYRAEQAIKQYPSQAFTFFDYFAGVNSEGLEFLKNVEYVFLKNNHPQLYQLIEAFINAQLVINCGNQQLIKVKLAHDSLFKQWQQLKEWLADNKDYLVFRSKIDGQFTQWQDTKGIEKNSYLLQSEGLLQDAKKLVEEKKIRKTQIEEFIELSIKRHKEQEAKTIIAQHNTGLVLIEKANEGLQIQSKTRALLLSLAALGKLLPGKDLQASRHALQIANKSTNINTQVLSGFQHRSEVVTIAFSPDGKTLASGYANNNICLWNIISGDCISIFNDHSGEVSSVVFSPDGNTLISGSLDHTVRLWNISEGMCFSIFKEHSTEVFSVAISPNNKIIASSDANNKIYLSCIDRGEIIFLLDEHLDDVTSVAFSPDGKTLASGSDDKTIRLWSVDTGHCLFVLDEHSDTVTSVAFSPDGKILASGSADKSIRLWDIHDVKCLSILGGLLNQDIVMSVRVSPCGKFLAAGELDGAIRLWDISNGGCFSVLEDNPVASLAIDFSFDGKLLASASSETIFLWDINNKKRLPISREYGGSVRSLDFSPDGKSFLAGGFDRKIRLWDTVSGEVISTFSGHTEFVNCVTFSPDGRTFVSGGGDKTIRLWDVYSKKCILVFRGHLDEVTSLVFSSNGAMLASGGVDKNVYLWSITGEQLGDGFNMHSETVTCVAFTPNGRILASGSEDKTIHLWDVTSFPPLFLAILEGHSRAVSSIVFSPDGKTLASGGWDNTICLWDIARKKSFHTFKDHLKGVTTIVFSLDGRVLASGGGDGDIRLWNITDKSLSATFEGHSGIVSSISLSPDSKTLVSASTDKTIRLWSNPEPSFTICKEHNDQVQDIVYFPNGKTLASTGSGTVSLWDVVSKKKYLKIQRTYGYNLAVSPCGKYLAIGDVNYEIIFWDTYQEESYFSLKGGHTEPICSLDFSPNSKFLVSGSIDNTVCLWSVNHEKIICIFKEHSHHVMAVAFSPCGKIIASGDFSGQIYLCSSTFDNQLFSFDEIKIPTSSHMCLTFSPDGKVLAFGGTDEIIHLWSIEKRQVLSILKGHKGCIRSVSFSPDGQTLASGSEDETVRLWDAMSGDLLSILDQHKDEVTSVSFSPDGKSLVSGGSDKTIIFWSLDDIVSFKNAKNILDKRRKQWMLEVQNVEVCNSIKPTYNLYQLSINTSPLIWPKSHPLYWRSTAEQGDGKSMIELGNIYLKDGNTTEAKKWYTRALVVTEVKLLAVDRLRIIHSILALNSLSSSDDTAFDFGKLAISTFNKVKKYFVNT